MIREVQAASLAGALILLAQRLGVDFAARV